MTVATSPLLSMMEIVPPVSRVPNMNRSPGQTTPPVLGAGNCRDTPACRGSRRRRAGSGWRWRCCLRCRWRAGRHSRARWRACPDRSRRRSRRRRPRVSRPWDSWWDPGDQESSRCWDRAFPPGAGPIRRRSGTFPVLRSSWPDRPRRRPGTGCAWGCPFPYTARPGSPPRSWW